MADTPDIEIGREVLPKTRVYLDIKYWIYLRDAARGQPVDDCNAHRDRPAPARAGRTVELVAGRVRPGRRKEDVLGADEHPPSADGALVAQPG